MYVTNLKKAFKDLAEGWRRYPIWIHQAYHALSSKYKRTIFGSLWLSANFLISSCSIAFVFGSLFKQDISKFISYCLLGNLFAGIILWIVTDAPEIFMNNGGLIKNNAIPFSYYVFEGAAKLMMMMLINLCVYYVLMIAFGFAVIPNPVALVGIFVDLIGIITIGCLVGMLSARFRDLRFLLPNLSMFMFFVTPIYWKPDMLGNAKYIAEINPLYHMISVVREPILGGWPTITNWAVSISIAVFGIIMWLIFFPTFRKRIPFWV